MKSVSTVMVAFFLASMALTPARAWDVEHDVVAQLTGEFLPADIKACFTFADFGVLLEHCHYPDECAFRKYHSLDDIGEIVGPADKMVLSQQGFRNAGWLHRERGRGTAFALLARAFANGEHAKAAFWLSVLTHAVSDESALNHPPLLQFVQYSRFEGVDYAIRKVEPEAKNVFSFRTDGPVVRKVRERLRGYSSQVPEGDFTAVTRHFIADAVRQADVAARLEGTIAFAPRAEAEEALADLVAMQVKILVDMAWTAWRLRDPAAPLPDAGFDDVCATRMDALTRTVDPGRQSVFAGVFDMSKDPPKPKGTIGFVCEPYAMFARGRLSYVGRMLTASATRTLRDHGWAARGIALADLAAKGLPPPSDVPVVFVSLGPCRLLPEEVEAFRRYRAAGGRLIAVGGADANNVTGLRDLMERHADDEVPVSSKWGMQNEKLWKGMSVSFAPGFGACGAGPFPLVRNPNIDGFCKPYASFAFKPAAAVEPLAYLDNGRGRLLVAARAGNVVWLPEYLLMPFLFSHDTTLDWQAMRLDSFASKVLLSALTSLVDTGFSR